MRSVVSSALLFIGWVCGLFTALRADVLIYADGDRVQGTYVKRQDGSIIFNSMRFGELRVPEGQATVLVESTLLAKADTPAEKRPAKASATPAAGDRPAPAHAHGPLLGGPLTSVVVRTAEFGKEVGLGVVHWWSPWKGRLGFSTEVLNNTSNTSSVLVEAKLTRNWAKDEVKIEPRYEYKETDGVPTVDLMKFVGSWRHDLPGRMFGLYRPSVQYDRVGSFDDVDIDYVLAQQEIGVGYTFFNETNRQLRAGLSENFFNVWVMNRDFEIAERVESIFAEVTWQLPWRVSLTERGVFYFSVENDGVGWENDIEINKKLTTSLSIGLRHEVREGTPDIRVQDYSKLRFTIGYDF